MFSYRTQSVRRAFTLIELLVVIAIIAILAAILFPAFAAAREQARQSNTISNMHDIYEGARIYKEDNGQYPASLFGYAEVASPNAAIPGSPAGMPALPSDLGTVPIVPMEKATENFSTVLSGILPYLYPHQVKDYTSFLCPDNPVTSQTAVTEAYYPLALTGGVPTLVTWQSSNNNTPCPGYGDTDLPVRQLAGGTTDPTAYLTQPKLFYTMDTMDIGPMVNSSGQQMRDAKGNLMYELHYTPDWTHLRYNIANACDVFGANGIPAYGDEPAGTPVTEQMKYKNPPTENTILTWNTQHAASAGSGNVIIILLSGTARKINLNQALQQLPLDYH